MKTKIFLLLLFLGIMDISCKKDEQQQNNYFPNNIGYQWIYRLTNNTVDTIKVDVVSEGTLPNGVSAKIWKYTYKQDSQTYIDTVWVSQTNSDVRIYDNPCRTCTDQMPFERLHYIIPLRVGNSWSTNAAYGDTTKVLDQENVSVPEGTFTDVFRISKVRGYVTNSWTKDTIYFKEHVGLIKLSQNEFNLGPLVGNGIWELISHNF